MGLVEGAIRTAQQQRVGLSTRLNEAATALGLPGTNDVATALASIPNRAPESIALGGPDPAVAALLPPLAELTATNQVSAFDVFLPAASRAKLRARLGESRSPGVQVLLKTLDLPTQQFVPANQPGGQPFEAVVLLTATLYERERFSPTMARTLRELAEQAPDNRGAQQRLEELYLNLLSLSRRLDWSSLAELARIVPDISTFEQFAAAVRANPSDLPLLYSSALLSGDAAGVTRQLNEFGDVGRRGLSQGLRDGAGAVRLLGSEGRPLLPGLACPDVLAQAVQRAPAAWAFGRSALFLVAAILGGLSLRAFSRIGLPESASAHSEGTGSLYLVAAFLGGFFMIASEPLPSRRSKTPPPKFYLDSAALTKSTAVANSSHPQKNIMEPTTLVTLLIFGVIQLVVYVICIRKISEITRLPDPPSVRLKLLENEENLFDAGLYVGIAGTAAALVMQVLQLVEANLLAAYSSNLMGIISVAVIKIGHVRQARRRLILESLAAGPSDSTDPASGQVPVANPFTFR